MLSILEFWGWLDCWPIIGHLLEAEGLWYVMSCRYCLISIFLKLNHGNVMVCSMRCLYLLFIDNLQYSCVKLRCMCIYHFWVFDQYFFETFSSCSLRIDGYCDLLWDIFWFLIENQWTLWFIIWCFSIVHGELMRYCGISFDAL